VVRIFRFAENGSASRPTFFGFVHRFRTAKAPGVCPYSEEILKRMGLRLEGRNRLVTKLVCAVILNEVKDLKTKILRYAQNDKRYFRYNFNDVPVCFSKVTNCRDDY